MCCRDWRTKDADHLTAPLRRRSAGWSPPCCAAADEAYSCRCCRCCCRRHCSSSSQRCWPSTNQCRTRGNRAPHTNCSRCAWASLQKCCSGPLVASRRAACKQRRVIRSVSNGTAAQLGGSVLVLASSPTTNIQAAPTASAGPEHPSPSPTHSHNTSPIHPPSMLTPHTTQSPSPTAEPRTAPLVGRPPAL